MNAARAPLRLQPSGIEVQAFVCHCGVKLWPLKSYRDHLKTAHGGATESTRVCLMCHRKKPLGEFLDKSHWYSNSCRSCRAHAAKGRRKSVRSKKAGRPRQYTDVVLSDRIGFRTIYRSEK
jgi:hypothetical protein